MPTLPFDWQDLTTGLILLAAIVYLARNLAGTFGPASRGCAKGCASCPSSPTGPSTGQVAEPQLIQIGIHQPSSKL